MRLWWTHCWHQLHRAPGRWLFLSSYRHQQFVKWMWSPIIPQCAQCHGANHCSCWSKWRSAALALMWFLSTRFLHRAPHGSALWRFCSRQRLLQPLAKWTFLPTTVVSVHAPGYKLWRYVKGWWVEDWRWASSLPLLSWLLRQRSVCGNRWPTHGMALLGRRN